MQINFTLDTSSVTAEDVRLIESVTRHLAIQVASRVATSNEPAEAPQDLGYPTEAKPIKARKARATPASDTVKELVAEAEKETAPTFTEDDLKKEEADWEEYQAEKGEGISDEEIAALEDRAAGFPETPQSAYTYKGKSIPFAKFLELYKSGEAKFEDFTFGKAPEGTDFKAISDLYRPKSTVAGNGAKYRAFLNWLGGLQSAKEAKSEVYLPILDFLTSL